MDDKTKPHIKDFILYLLGIVAIIVAVIFMFSKPSSDSLTRDNEVATASAQQKPGKYDSPPVIMIDENKKYQAKMTTSLGEILIELFASETPIAVNNFVFLANDGFYNGTVFHRIVKGFMIQGGDPNGNGTGGPGYSFNDEKISRDYKKGIVAMANSGPNTNGSQFFIMHQDTDLPKNYVIFGSVTNGMDAVDKIAAVEVEDNGQGEISKPKEKIMINNISISEK